jgi:hypothetical protein
MRDEQEYLGLVKHHCAVAVEEFAAAIGETEMQRRAIRRYLKRGRAAGIFNRRACGLSRVSCHRGLSTAEVHDGHEGSRRLARLVVSESGQ